MIVDAEGQILGRLASGVAKRLMDGEEIEVVNCGKAVITGNPEDTVEEYLEEKDIGSPRHGPYAALEPASILRKAIKGMLPMKKTKGEKAFKRLEARDGNPSEKEGEKIAKGIEGLTTNYITLEELSKRIKMERSEGKRKEARARAKIEEGSGEIRINSKPLEAFSDELVRLMIREPLEIAESLRGEVDINVDVEGGGKVGQAEAVRQAIARGLVKFSDDEELAERMEEYDRNLLVRDGRTTEPHKPSVSSKGARKHKQRSKR